MRCPTCHGARLIRTPDPDAPRYRFQPCPDCGGCGFAHCCEGDRATPDLEDADDAHDQDPAPRR